MKSLKMLALTKYGRMGASSRMRSLQYLPWLQQAGIQVTVQPLLSDASLQKRYRRGGHSGLNMLQAYVHRCRALLQRKRFDVVWIEKEALPWWPLWLERALLRGIPYVLDYDDAIFHRYDLYAHPWVRCLFGRRLDGLMAHATLVVAGNDYLAQRARDAGAPWVEVLPTVIDLDRYPHRPHTPVADRLLRIVWIGSPTTTRYLGLLREPLQALAERQPIVLRVIGGGEVNLPGVQVENVPWSEASEVENVIDCDVGVMPLLDSPWEQGKCGYKLIQYMACGLPVVASPVGVNSEIVEHGQNGFLARTPQEWVQALQALLLNAGLRQHMGHMGRNKVEEHYALQVTGPRLAKLIRQAAGTRP